MKIKEGESSGVKQTSVRGLISFIASWISRYLKYKAIKWTVLGR